MKKNRSRTKLLEAFATRQGSAEQFAKRHGLSVSTLYRWQSEQAVAGFVEIKPDGMLPQNESRMVLEKGELRIEFTALPDVGYMQALLNMLL